MNYLKIVKTESIKKKVVFNAVFFVTFAFSSEAYEKPRLISDRPSNTLPSPDTSGEPNPGADSNELQACEAKKCVFYKNRNIPLPPPWTASLGSFRTKCFYPEALDSRARTGAECHWPD